MYPTEALAHVSNPEFEGSVQYHLEQRDLLPEQLHTLENSIGTRFDIDKTAAGTYLCSFAQQPTHRLLEQHYSKYNVTRMREAVLTLELDAAQVVIECILPFNRDATQAVLVPMSFAPKVMRHGQSERTRRKLTRQTGYVKTIANPFTEKTKPTDDESGDKFYITRHRRVRRR